MQTTIENTDPHKVKLTIEVPPEEYGKDVDRAYRAIAQSVRIPGFRKGKAPRQIIDTQIGRDAVVEQFVRESLWDYYMAAVREHDLAPITDPDISLDSVDFEQPLQFTAEVEVRPRVELKDYKGLRVERPAVEVSDEEVDDYVGRLRDRFAELETVERPIIDDDFTVIDIRGTRDDEEIPEATQADFLYEVGTGLLDSIVDEQLRGKRKGDILKFEATLPEGSGEHGGEQVTFTVLVKEVKTKKLPEADDDFAKTASEFDTLAELRADIRENIEKVKDREADAVVRDRTLTAVIDKVDVDLPETLIEQEAERRIAGAAERYEQLGVSLEDALEQQGLSEEAFNADAREHAVRAIKADLALESIARQEDLQVTPEELAAEISALAQALGRDPKSTAKALNESGQVTSVAADIIRSKALDLLVEAAETIPEVAADTASGDEEAAGETPADTPETDQGEE
jgi:trigger factor